MQRSSSPHPQPPSRHQAQQLLASMPRRPRRTLTARDHLTAVAIVLCSLGAGLLAARGHAWWAITPALAGALGAHHWVSRRLNLANEPRLRAATITTIFTVWLALPIWHGITRDEVLPYPEVFIVAGLAPAAWLAFYAVLLLRR